MKKKVVPGLGWAVCPVCHAYQRSSAQSSFGLGVMQSRRKHSHQKRKKAKDLVADSFFQGQNFQHEQTDKYLVSRIKHVKQLIIFRQSEKLARRSELRCNLI